MAGDDDLTTTSLDEDLFVPPPPPPPPSLGPLCSSSPSLYCELEGGPMGAHFDRAAFPSLPVIAVCSSVVLVALLVASFLLWRHKSKVQNLLPCKSEQPGHLGELGAANGVTYEDVLINHHPTRLPGTQTLMPLEILDVKLGDIGPPPSMHPHHHHHHHPPPPPTTFYPSNREPPFHHPVYEEVSQAPPDADHKGSGRGLTSEEEEEDEEGGSGPCSASSSVRGSTGGDLSRDPVSSSEEDCCEYGPPTTFDYPRSSAAAAPPYHQQRPAPSQWPVVHPYQASQENIYSTIDEDEYLDGRSTTTTSPKGRTDDGGSSSYGDIRPAAFHHPAPFT